MLNHRPGVPGMNHWRALAVAALAAVATLVLPARADACSCLPSGPACQAYWQVDTVFDGTVTSIESVEASAQIEGRSIPIREHAVTFSVTKGWKNIDQTTVVVRTSAFDASCGYDFKIGGRYLVFGNGTGNDIRVSLCSATQPYDGAGPSAVFLASLAKPSKGGRVFGTVTAHDGGFPPTTDQRIDVPVQLHGDGKPRTTSSRGGQFSFGELPPGRYTVEATAPPGYALAVPASARRIDIASAHACAELDLYVRPTGAILGRLTYPDGQPARNVAVQVTGHATPLDQPYVPSAVAQTDPEGNFRVSELPPGRYVVGLNLTDLPDRLRPYPRTLYARKGEASTPVEVALGQAVDIGAWQIPPPLAAIKISGTLAWIDGSPAGGMTVTLLDTTDPRRGRGRFAGTALADAQGHFVVEGRDGRTYQFEVMSRSGRVRIVTPPAVTASRDTAPIRLVLER